MALLLRPQVALGDGPCGYLMQLAEANRLAMRDMVAIGVTFDADVLRMQRCAPPEGIDPVLDRYLGYVSSHLAKHPSSWIRRSSRCCPVCLSNLSRWRVGWEILYADACPTHNVWLIDVCSCGQPITWQRGTLLKCDCGRPLQRQPSASCPEAVARLSAALADKMFGNSTTSGLGPVDELSVSQLQRLIRLLGSYCDSDPGRRPQKISHQDRLATSWRLTSLGAELLKGWPESLYAVLDRMQHERSADGCGRLSGSFGYFYTALYKGFPEEVFAPLRDAFENYVADHWRGALGKRNRRLPPSILQRAAWIPANHACQRLGISLRRLTTLIGEKRIAGETRLGPSGREFIVVRREDVDSQVAALSREVDLYTAAGILGVTKRRMQILLPRLFPEAHRTTNVTSPWAIPRERLDRLTEIIIAAQGVTTIPVESIVLAHVLKFWAWTDAVVADAISAIIANELVPLCALSGVPGIAALTFREHDLREWHARTRHAATDLMTVPEVADRLGIKQEVAYALTRTGLLPTVALNAGTKRGGQGISSVALEAFGRRYVFARDLAKRLGRSPKAVVKNLALLGLRPVCGPQVDGCRQVLYESNQELTRAVASLTAASKLTPCSPSPRRLSTLWPPPGSLTGCQRKSRWPEK